MLTLQSKTTLMSTIIALAVVQATCGPSYVRGQTEEEAMAIIQSDVGTWHGTMKYWPRGKDAEPETVDVLVRNAMLGKYWLETTFEGEIAGEKEIGRGFLNFDANTGTFVRRWFDSQSPQMSKNVGRWDAETNTMTYLADQDHESINLKIQTQVHYQDENTRRLTSLSRPLDREDDEFEVSFEIVYHRDK